jgi:hypothetical protein
LRRRIPASGRDDAMACYPLFSCLEWSGLRDDLDELRANLVSIVMVTDPFGNYDVPYLNACFPEVVIPFKQHFITDLSRRPETFVSAHHIRNARKSLRDVRVERSEEPLKFLDVWSALYDQLIARHSVAGIAAFSKKSFARQLTVPGINVFRATHRDQTIGMLLWYIQGDVAYYHLGAYSDLGYELLSSFALFTYCIEYFAQQGIKWLNLGAGAGLGADAQSGLSRFKRGWSTDVRTTYLCGRIFDKGKYNELVGAREIKSTKYFPAYRLGEFQ